MPDADSYTDVVLDKLRQFIRIAEKHDIVLLHENEKGIYGDTGARCKLLFDRLACPHFKAAFDFANFVQCEQDTAECWELLHDQIAYIHIKDALPGYLLNVPAGTGLGKIPELLRRAFCEEGYHGFLTLEPHLAMFDFFAPGAKGGKSQKLQFENNPIVEKMKSEMAEPGRPKDGAEAYATQYHALVEIRIPFSIDIHSPFTISAIAEAPRRENRRGASFVCRKKAGPHAISNFSFGIWQYFGRLVSHWQAAFFFVKGSFVKMTERGTLICEYQQKFSKHLILI